MICLINKGLYDSKEVAAKAYDDAAKRLHKEFANVNFIS